jgi:hypothetical protein
MSVADLRFFVAEEVPRMVTFLREVRALGPQPSLTRDQVYNLFKGAHFWQERPTKSGHCTFQHAISGAKIGFQAHGSPQLNVGHVLEIRDIVQGHLNWFHNTVFALKDRSWLNLNFESAAQRLAQLPRPNFR